MGLRHCARSLQGFGAPAVDAALVDLLLGTPAFAKGGSERRLELGDGPRRPLNNFGDALRIVMEPLETYPVIVEGGAVFIEVDGA